MKKMIPNMMPKPPKSKTAGAPKFVKQKKIVAEFIKRGKAK